MSSHLGEWDKKGMESQVQFPVKVRDINFEKIDQKRNTLSH